MDGFQRTEFNVIYLPIGWEDYLAVVHTSWLIMKTTCSTHEYGNSSFYATLSTTLRCCAALQEGVRVRCSFRRGQEGADNLKFPVCRIISLCTRSAMASLGLCGILAAALALCCACATAPTAASRRRPQVILHILADDLGWAELGYHNEEARIAGACVCVSDSLPPPSVNHIH